MIIYEKDNHTQKRQHNKKNCENNSKNKKNRLMLNRLMLRKTVNSENNKDSLVLRKLQKQSWKQEPSRVKQNCEK